MSQLDKIGKTVVALGRTGSGKTPVVNRLILESGIKNKVVYDHRKESLKGKHYNPKIWTVFYNFETFFKYFPKITDSAIVLEESSVFTKRLIATDKLSEVMSGIQHNRNTVYFLFHSLRKVPPELLDWTDYYILLKTNDKIETVKRKCSALLPYFPFGAKGDTYIDNDEL